MPRTKKRPSQQVKKKGISKRQETSLDKHGDKYGAKHKAFMKRRMLMGDSMRAAHKKAKAST